MDTELGAGSWLLVVLAQAPGGSAPPPRGRRWLEDSGGIAGQSGDRTEGGRGAGRASGACAPHLYAHRAPGDDRGRTRGGLEGGAHSFPPPPRPLPSPCAGAPRPPLREQEGRR